MTALTIVLVSDTGSSSTDRITSNPAVKGTAAPYTVVIIKEGATTLGIATTDSTGAWSFTPRGLANGAHTLTVTAAGNTGTATLSFTLDRTAPAVSMALVADTGSSSTDRITSNPAVKGTGEPNAVVTIKEGGTTLGTTTADSTGAWSFTPTSLTDGTHTLTATETDAAGNTGTATLSFTLDRTAPPQPSQPGDIVGINLQNTGSMAENSGYVTFGQVFEAGMIRPGDSLVARIDGVEYAVQTDVEATYGDGSVRHAVLTLHAPTISPGDTVAVMLAKDSAAMPSPSAPSASALLASGYDITTSFTFHNTDGTTTADNASAAAALQAAINAGNVTQRLAGPEVNEYDVVTTVDGSKLKVEFDIRAYADSTTTTDVIFDNSWMFSSGKTNLVYDVAISQGGQQVYSASNVSQYLYSQWDHEVDSAGAIKPNVHYDVSYLTEAAGLPAYDQSYGVSNTAIQANYSRLNPAASTGYGSTGPLGTAEVLPAMPAAGGRPDIGTQPNWVAQWVLGQDTMSNAVMMANADAAGGIPWHLVDEDTGTLIRRDQYPYFWQDARNSGTGYWSPKPANGWPTYGANGDPWIPDTAHLPDLNYVPYLITGSHYQLEQLQAEADFAITSHNPYYDYDQAAADPVHPGSAIYMGVASPNHQERAIAWGLRQVAEAASATPDDDPLKSYFTSELVKSMDGLVKYYITDKSMAQYGDLQGFVLGGETVSGVPVMAPWCEDYIVTVLAEIAGMNLPQASDDAVQMLDYMTNFAAGLFTNGQNGYNPANGAAYWLYLKDPSTGTAYSTWSQLSDGNVADYKLNTGGWGLATANPTGLNVNSLADMQGGYGVIARAALADLITYTQSAQAIEAYGYITSQMVAAWGSNIAGMANAYRNYPEWDAMPRLPDGEYLHAGQIQVDTSNNSTVTLKAAGGDSMLSVVGQGTATLIGGSGGTDLLFGGSGPATLIAGTGSDYLFAGKGATTFIDNVGNDYMKGGSAADTFTFTDVNSGHDIVVGFKVGEDVLKIASNLNGNGITSAADLVSGASVVNGSTVLHLGPDQDVTIRGIDTPATLVNSILMV